MPEVTVWPMPNGLPTATTKSPTSSFELSANGIAVSGVSLGTAIRISAMSVSGSEPTNSACIVRPSLSVTDTGSGISPERRSELFSPLFTTKPLGLGLGLVTARTLIERQGGALEYVPSDANRRGATFVVRLPAGVLDEAAT